MKTEADKLIVMGRIVAPYGIKGWVKVLPDTETIDGLLDYSTWQIGRESNWRSIKLKSGKVHNDVLLIKLEGINDRDAAFACKGLQVAVPRSALPELDDSEVYWSDLIGLAVTNQQEVDFGKVVDVFETGANDVLVVKGDRERLIPFAKQTIVDVDVEQQVMRVDWDADY